MNEKTTAAAEQDARLGVKLVLAACSACGHRGPIHPDLLCVARCNSCGGTARPTFQILRAGAFVPVAS